MSVTIRYHGSLKDMRAVEELQEEFLDIAITNEWPSEIIDGAYSSLRREDSTGPASSQRGIAATLSPPLTLKGIKLGGHPPTHPPLFTVYADATLTPLRYFFFGP